MNLFQIMPFANKAGIVGKTLGIDLPPTGQSISHEGAALRWAGQNSWYIENAANFPALKSKLKEVASVVNQSDSFTVLEISGLAVEDLLQKGCGIDFNILSFPVGNTATSLMAHTHVHITRLEPNSFQLLIPASYAVSYWHWLALSAEEFGYEVL